MKITWYGTASISVETENSAVLFDPYIPCKGSKTPSAEKEFLNFKNIVITHGHVDHISTLPITVPESGATVWCTKTPFETLVYKGISPDNLKLIAPGNVLNFGDIKITVFQSRHVKFDRPLIFKTAFSPRIFKYFGNLMKIFAEVMDDKENNETVGFLIEAEGKKIYLMGSLSWAEEVEYPKDIDLLILPYQGTTDLLTPGLKFIEKVNPKAVFLDHFDDTFPPLSDTVDTSDIVAALDGKIPLTIPEFEKAYEF